MSPNSPTSIPPPTSISLTSLIEALSSLLPLPPTNKSYTTLSEIVRLGYKILLNKDDGGEGGRVVLALLWSLRDKDNCGHFDKAKIEAFRTSVSGASGDEGHEWYDEVKLCEEFREGQGAEFVLSLVRSMEEGVENDVGALSATTMGYAEVGMLWNLLDVRAMMSMQEFFHLLQQSSEESGSIKPPGELIKGGEEGEGDEEDDYDEVVGIDEVRIFLREFVDSIGVTLEGLR